MILSFQWNVKEKGRRSWRAWVLPHCAVRGGSGGSFLSAAAESVHKAFARDSGYFAERRTVERFSYAEILYYK